MKKTKKQLLAQIDSAIKSHFPTAKPISESLVKDLWCDEEFRPLAYYITENLPEADEYGCNEDFDRDDLDDYDFVAITIVQHIDSGRVFFSKLNRFGESVNSYGETDGEIDEDTLIFEHCRDHELI
jgi:hypothetical protein